MLRETDCPSCDVTTYYSFIVVLKSASLKRMKKVCPVCGNKMEPKVNAQGDMRHWAVNDPHFPGVVIAVCRECATYCDDCRYVFND